MSIDLLERAPLFADLSPEEQALLAERLHLLHFAGGDVVFSEDDPSSALYLIRRGGVRLTIGPMALATLGAGAVFGESDVFVGRRRSTNAISTGNTDAWALSQHDLAQIVSEYPVIGLKLSRSFGAMLVQMERYLVDQRLRSVPGLDTLSDDMLQEIATRLSLETIRPGRYLYRLNDAADGLYLLEGGVVQIQRNDAFVAAKIGDVLGLMAVLAEKPHMESAQAQEETLAWKLSQKDFDDLTNRWPELRAALSQTLRMPLSQEDESLAIERLRALPLFTNLDQKLLRSVAQCLLLQHVPAGEIIFIEGSPGDALYLVDTGKVEIISSATRRGEILARLGPGGFFGEMALLTGKSRNTGARAAADTNLWTLYRTDFDELVARYPALANALAHVLSDRLDRASDAFIEKHLRRVTLFNGLTASQLAEVAEQLFPARYRAERGHLQAGNPG